MYGFMLGEVSFGTEGGTALKADMLCSALQDLLLLLLSAPVKRKRFQRLYDVKRDENIMHLATKECLVFNHLYRVSIN
jgi:hypothetical protein